MFSPIKILIHYLDWVRNGEEKVLEGKERKEGDLY